MDQMPIEVSAALASDRRRARLLEEAHGDWSWRDLSLALPLALAGYLIWSGSGEISDTTLGFILLISAVGGWQHYRLRRRVEALSTLLKEVGYPREA